MKKPKPNRNFSYRTPPSKTPCLDYAFFAGMMAIQIVLILGEVFYQYLNDKVYDTLINKVSYYLKSGGVHG